MNILKFNASTCKLTIAFLYSYFLFLTPLRAQYFPNYSIPVYQGSRLLPMAWVGGLNNPQFSSADLNNDGINDLVIFDRTGNKFLTFINNNKHDTISYTYAPKYELNFPSINSWALLLDYTHDGIPDIFAHTLLGVQVYKGYYNSKNELCFNLYTPLIYFSAYNGYANLPVTSVDIPGFADFDNDGDIDILTWDELGGYLNLYKNLSEEKGYGTDSFNFILEDQCWGKFYEETNKEAKDLYAPCPFFPEYHGLGNQPKRHSGHVTCPLSNNIVKNDLKDVIIGNLGFNDLVYLHNFGYIDSAICNYQDSAFPFYSVPALMNSFPAAFNLDLDNDSLKDIIAAPNQEGGATNIANVWYYKNVGDKDTGIFIYQTDSLFTKDMIEVGEGAAPVFAKLDNDSLYDLIVSNNLSYGIFAVNNSQLAYYKNIGTRKKPVFTLTTKDYMNLSSLKMTGLYPAVGDLDGDGDLDMVLGNESGKLLYFENTAGAGKPANFILKNASFLSIKDNFATPQLVDVNNDGLLDLLVGEQNGTIGYFQNTGTATTPSFSSTPTSSSFGGVNVQRYPDYSGYSVPFLTNLNNGKGTVLLVGSLLGTIFEYDNIDNNLRGNFNLDDSAFSSIATGINSTISGADINDDGVPELAIGNYRGGVTIYDTVLSHALAVNTVNHPSPKTKIYPNPTDGKFTMDVTGLVSGTNPLISITNMLGQPVEFNTNYSGKNKFILTLNNCPNGIYFCTINYSGETLSDKIILEK